MKNHTDLLNYIAAKLGALVYIEIGVFNPNHNFNHIRVPMKIGVDPDPNARAMIRATSDEFFSDFNSRALKTCLTWIDGLHHAEQVKKDILNAWTATRLGGVIALHDCNPHSERITHVPRDSREWCGDVYKAIMKLQQPEFFTVDFDYGCCIIRKTDGPLTFSQDRELAWDVFDKERKEFLKLISLEESIKWIDSWT